jgi:hypothetical protein
MAHDRSRSGNVLVPLASGGRHECFRTRRPLCNCRRLHLPLPSASSFLDADGSAVRPPEYGRYGSTARTLVGGEDEAEHVNALLLGV